MFLFGREVILNVEELSNFWDRLVFYQAGDFGAGELEQGLDVEVVAGHDELKQDFLVEVDELCVPWVDDLGHVGADKGLGNLRWSVVLHVSTELNNLL